MKWYYLTSWHERTEEFKESMEEASKKAYEKELRMMRLAEEASDDER